MGRSLPAGLTADALLADLTNVGRLREPKGWINQAQGGGPYLFIGLPEPPSILLLAFGLLGLVGLRRNGNGLC